MLNVEYFSMVYHDVLLAWYTPNALPELSGRMGSFAECCSVFSFAKATGDADSYFAKGTGNADNLFKDVPRSVWTTLRNTRTHTDAT